MTKERCMQLLNEIIDYTCLGRNTNEQIEELVKMGFTTSELVDDFSYSLTDVREWGDLNITEE